MSRYREGIQEPYIDSGYTGEGIYYEVYGTEAVPYADNHLTVTRIFTYDGIITPNNEIAWKEIMDGNTYAGTLQLVSFYYNNQKTTATYTGILYKQ